MAGVEEATKILLETDFQSGSYSEDYLQWGFFSVIDHKYRGHYNIHNSIYVY